MSIASNVISTNNNLTTARTKLRNILNNYNVTYYNDDSVFTLTRRLKLIYKSVLVRGYSYADSDEVIEGSTNSFSVNVMDNNHNDQEGIPVDFYITVGGITTHKVIVTDSDGDADIDVTFGEIGETDTVTAYLNGEQIFSLSYTIKAFYFNENSLTIDSYSVVKYPESATLTSSSYEWDSNYNDYGVKVSKEINSSSAIYLIPTVFIDGIDVAEYGIHIQANIVVKYGSSSGWACGIGLLASTALSHYRDTKILELGAYPGKKGLRYSTSDHVIRDSNVTSGQLTLNSVWYTFDLYFKDGNVKATIKNGNTNVYSYEGSTLTFETCYPFLTIYDYGGQMIFNNVTVEEWDGE